MVFSNLFKKIEKEIKQDEERYKELLLKNEMMLENKRRPRRGEGLKEENDVFEGTIVDGFNEFNIVPEEDGKDHGLIVNNRSGKNKVYKHEDKQNSTPKVQVQR